MPDQNEITPLPLELSLEQKLSMWLEHIEPALLEFKKETDRGAALFGASILDQALLELLEAFLVKGSITSKLFDYPAPLSSFSARQNMCLALGLISRQEYDDCTLLRKIRNEFAHVANYSIDFENEKMSAFCKNLSDYHLAKNMDSSLRNINRMAFIFSASVLHIKWTARIRFSRKNKRTLFTDEVAGHY